VLTHRGRSPPSRPPENTRVAVSPATGGLGAGFGGHSIAVMGLTGRRRVAARSGELCPLPVPSCLQPARAQQLSPVLHTPSQPLSQSPQHSPPSSISGEGVGARLAPGARPGGEKGGGDGDGSSCKDRAKKRGSSRDGVHPQQPWHKMGGCPMPRGRSDPPASYLPSCPPAPGELLHHEGGEDADAAVEVACPETVVHLAGGTGQHPDDGPLGEAQLLGALPLVVIQGSHQPGCGEDGAGGSAPAGAAAPAGAQQPLSTSPTHPSPSPGKVTPQHSPPGSSTSSAAMMLESWR